MQGFASVKSVSVEFVNDGVQNGKDVNLYIKHLYVGSVKQPLNEGTVNYYEGKKELRLDDDWIVMPWNGTVVLNVTEGPYVNRSLIQEVTRYGQTLHLHLQRYSVRGSHFEVLEQTSSGGYQEHKPGPVRTLIGYVEEDPSAVAVGYEEPDGTLWTKTIFDFGTAWVSKGAQVVETQATNNPDKYHWPSTDIVSSGHAGKESYQFDVGVDITHWAYTTHYQSDASTALMAVEKSMISVLALYARDELLHPLLSRVVIRTDADQDPYDGLSDIPFLEEVAVQLHRAITTWFAMWLSASEPAKATSGIGGTSVNGIMLPPFGCQVTAFSTGHTVTNWVTTGMRRTCRETSQKHIP